MPRKKSKTVPEGNHPVPHHDEFGCGKPTMADLYRMLKRTSIEWTRTWIGCQAISIDKIKKLVKLTEEMKKVTNRRLAGLDHEARQPHLATEANVEPDTKTRKHTEDAAADPAKHGDNISSSRVDHDRMRLTSFGNDFTEPPAPEKSIGDALVDKKGAEGQSRVSHL